MDMKREPYHGNYKGYTITEIFVPTHAKWMYIITEIDNAYFSTLKKAEEHIDNLFLK